MIFPIDNEFFKRIFLILPFLTTNIVFDYDDPQQWYINYPTCLGYYQSPIAINSHKVIPIALPNMLYGFYDVHFADPIIVHNVGHTVEFEVPNTILGERPFITGGLLTDVYVAEAVHFHWGSPLTKGTEHMLNGRRYDLEMHIVHRNTKYIDVSTARAFTDGLSVLAVLFKVVRTTTELYYPGLSEFYNALHYIGDFNATYSPDELLTLGSFLAQINRDHFYTYQGSLTTPPCSEAVTWIVFPEVVPISHLDLKEFWKLKNQDRRPLLNNFRPLQSSEYREIYHRLPTSDIHYSF